VAETSQYSATESLRDGSSVEIRALRPEDRDKMLSAVSRSSNESLHRRFFAVRRHFTDRELNFYLNVDFTTHVALVAVLGETDRDLIIGGARYVAIEPGIAEIAVTVVDEYQGQGVGTLLIRHLVNIARQAGLKEVCAEVLPSNSPMLKVFHSLGLPTKTRRDPETIHIRLSLT
jgi:RimJ/RimL family protein N-acetyltransferase